MSALLLAVMLGGCSSDTGLGDDRSPLSNAPDDNGETTGANDQDGDGGLDESLVRLDILPASGDLGLLPQTFVIAATRGHADLVLTHPVVVTGSVTAYEVTPYAQADLPGEPVAVEHALVSVDKPDSVQSISDVTASSDQDVPDGAIGTFSLTVAPDPLYRASIIPADPLIPFRSFALPVSTDEVVDVDLGYGVALYGRIVDGAGLPMAGVAIHAVDTYGVAGTDARTDADGLYLLRVDPGAYRVVASGREGRPDPVLETGPVDVGDEGAAVDLQYPALDVSYVSGRVVDVDGSPVAGVTARFRLLSLSDYDTSETNASLVIEAMSDRHGSFFTQLLHGTWHLDLLPADELDFSPSDEGEQNVVTGDQTLGDFTVLDTTPFQGTVVDGEGTAVPRAKIALREIGFGGRTWQGAADDTGSFWMPSAPQVPVEVTIVPPAERLQDLAITGVRLDPAETADAVLVLDAGVSLVGTVTVVDGGRSEAVANAIVEAVDAQGNRKAVALTDSDGAFAMRLTAH